MVFTKFAPLLAVAALASTTTAAAPIVHPGVHRTLREQNTVNLIVTMKGGVDSTLDAVKEAEFATRGQHIASLVADLEANAKTSQQAIDTLLSQEAAAATPLFTSQESFWISNQKAIKGATFELVEKLAAIQDIAEIREELVLPPPRFQVDAAANTTAIGVLANEWGVAKIQAPSVWAAGYNGQSIVIGSIDTGVLATHTSISSALRNSYNWYDPTARRTTPYDDNGHGTHTIGTMVGANGLGVAPGAKYISCRACTNDGCTEAALLSCAQFITCPTTPSGTGKDCTKAPQVVSNSWGGGQGDTFYASAIKTWRSAGIIPVFANGNEGPACKTASSPGDDANVIAVGATTSSDGLASFSSKGPAVNGLVKPEISGPGNQVRSAWNTGNSAYNTISGTSMATPHVSGVVALLLSKKPTLTFAQIKTAITTTADRTTLKASGYTCGNTKDTTFPNNQYGYGRINALKAFQSV